MMSFNKNGSYLYINYIIDTSVLKFKVLLSTNSQIICPIIIWLSCMRGVSLEGTLSNIPPKSFIMPPVSPVSEMMLTPNSLQVL